MGAHPLGRGPGCRRRASISTKNNSAPNRWCSDTAPAAKTKAVIYRIANYLNSPNVLTAGHFCYGPRISSGIVTCGNNPVMDYENFPKCIISWGNNVTIVNAYEHKGENFSVALDHGANRMLPRCSCNVDCAGSDA